VCGLTQFSVIFSAKVSAILLSNRQYIIAMPVYKNGLSVSSFEEPGQLSQYRCLTTDWRTGRSGFDPGQGQRIFPVTSVSRPALRSTQPPV
jgi:hypothetical protein